MKISLDPITRIEGHLAIKVDLDAGKVQQAWCSGEMFRGFENILRGRDPFDAQQIVQRICGVCPISHGMSSLLAQEEAYKISPPSNGRILRNLIQAANYIQSHIIHFYQLSALDFVDITAVTAYDGKDPALLDLQAWVKAQLASKMIVPGAPFLPRYEGDYVKDQDINIIAIRHYLDALEMRRLAHQAAALFCGKIPHATALVPGGVTERAGADKIGAYSSLIQRLISFVNNAYIPDVIAVAKAYPEYFKVGKSCGNFLAFGIFPETDNPDSRLFPAGVLMGNTIEPLDKSKILEEVKFSRFASATGLHPANGETIPSESKAEAYSWLKAPRYGGKPMEVGPLARVLIAYRQNKTPGLNALVDQTLTALGLPLAALDSTMGRHAVRALECKLIAERCLTWLVKLDPGAPSCIDVTIPDNGQGVGLWEAPRGALSHWITVKNKKIDNYQCVVPTTWNASPRDDRNVPGPIEQSLVGTPVANTEHPIEVARIVRSFDPCLACAVH